MARGVMLNTVGQVATEMGKLYRRAKAGRMDWNDAASASLILHRLRQCLEVGNIESRMAELEALAEQVQANGHRPTSHPQHYFRQ